MIYASPEPICFYKVKAHSGIAGNECADAIAKHSALHDGGHNMHFQPPAPDGNAYTHLYWLAAKDIDENPSGRGATSPRLRALSDLKAKLATNAFWNNSSLKFYEKRNVMRYRTGTVLIKNTASLPMQTALSALGLIVGFTYFQAANTLK